MAATAAKTEKHIDRLNRVVAAGMRRAAKLEPKLVEVLIPILDDTAALAATNFRKYATPAAGHKMHVVAAGRELQDIASTRTLQAIRELESATAEVSDAEAALIRAQHSGNPERIYTAKRNLDKARKRLARALQGEKPPPPPEEKPPQQPAQPQGPELPGDVTQGIQGEPGGVTPADVAKEIATTKSEEVRAEEEIANAVERLLESPAGDIGKRLTEIARSPFGGAADWVKPAADEILNLAVLADLLRGKTDPVRQAVVETMMQPAVEGAGVGFDLTNPFAAKVLQQSASQITNISETTQANVMKVIGLAHDSGLSIPETSKVIQAVMEEANPARARLIARTELVGAVNGGALAATQIVSDALGEVYLKQWLTAPGAIHPRHEDYDGLDEQTQQMDAAFDVGGTPLQFPGDPGGPPDEVCNCRCSIVFISAQEAADQGIEVGGTSTAPDTDTTPEEALALLKPIEMEGAPTEAELGITPFRAGEEPVGFYETPKAQQFEADLEPVAQQFGVTLDAQARTQGVWEGETEPSYNLRVHDGKEGVADYAAAMRAKYNQDGVLVFSPNPSGDSYRYVLHDVNPEAVIPKLTDHGIQGATATSDQVIIMGSLDDHTGVEALANEFKAEVTATRGDMSFSERGDTPRSLFEIEASHPNVDMAMSEADRGITLSMIRVPQELQGKGEAAAAMNDLLRYADAKGLTIGLTPEKVGTGMGVTKLRDWYKRLGFVSNTSGPGRDLRFAESMIRRPQAEALPSRTVSLYERAIQDAIRENDSEFTQLLQDRIDNKLTVDQVTARGDILRQRSKDLIALQGHRDPSKEISTLLAEEMGLKTKAEQTATDTARIADIEERIAELNRLRDSDAYAIVKDARKQLMVARRAAKKVPLHVAEAVTTDEVEYTLRDLLTDMPDEKYIVMPPQEIFWSIDGGDYHAGPMAAWRKDGIVWTKELQTQADAAAHPLSDAETAQIVESTQKTVENYADGLPEQIRVRVHNVNILAGTNPDDEYWKTVYPNFGGSAAASSDGHINFFQGLGDKASQHTFNHESGHLMFLGGGPKDEERWIDAANADTLNARARWNLGQEGQPDVIWGRSPGTTRPFAVGIRGVSEYGSVATAEDWAESIRLYVLDRQVGYIGEIEKPGADVARKLGEQPERMRVRFADLYPERAKLIDEWLHIPPADTVAATAEPMALPSAIEKARSDLGNTGVLYAPDPKAMTQVVKSIDNTDQRIGDLPQGAIITHNAKKYIVQEPNMRAGVVDSVHLADYEHPETYIPGGGMTMSAGIIVHVEDAQVPPIRQAQLDMTRAESMLTDGLEDHGYGALDPWGNPDPKSILTDNEARTQAKVEVSDTISNQLKDNPTWKAAVNEPKYVKDTEVKLGDVIRAEGGATIRVTKLEPTSGAKTAYSNVTITGDVIDPGPSSYPTPTGEATNFFPTANDKFQLLEPGELHPIPLHNPEDDSDWGGAKDREKRKDLNFRVAGGLIDGWAGTSADSSPWALAMQMAINKEFKQGVEPLKIFEDRSASAMKQARDIFKEKGPVMQLLVRQMYENTQRDLAEHGLKEVTLYRGTGDAPGPLGAMEDHILFQPGSSFSADYNIAKGFTGSDPAVVGVKVPADRILATPRTGFGALSEEEYVVLAPQAGAADDFATIYRGGDMVDFPSTVRGFWQAAEAEQRRPEMSWSFAPKASNVGEFEQGEFFIYDTPVPAWKGGNPVFKVTSKTLGGALVYGEVVETGGAVGMKIGKIVELPGSRKVRYAKGVPVNPETTWIAQDEPKTVDDFEHGAKIQVVDPSNSELSTAIFEVVQPKTGLGGMATLKVIVPSHSGEYKIGKQFEMPGGFTATAMQQVAKEGFTPAPGTNFGKLEDVVGEGEFFKLKDPSLVVADQGDPVFQLIEHGKVGEDSKAVVVEAGGSKTLEVGDPVKINPLFAATKMEHGGAPLEWTYTGHGATASTIVNGDYVKIDNTGFVEYNSAANQWEWKDEGQSFQGDALHSLLSGGVYQMNGSQGEGKILKVIEPPPNSDLTTDSVIRIPGEAWLDIVYQTPVKDPDAV